ncbi:hypothetical protein QN277_009434 [Acacia crassicarpa]|uniref:Uncharacterized protein n=1 Tax=Acacia crassicarpa TaxID=499986 RepID=A0AAE1IPY8_9FABA|nr:hypothetical protein QN277_009434 [Acacia crassicarpa]
MAGIDDSVPLNCDWGPPSPNPRSFFSKMLGEDNLSRQVSEPLGNGRTKELFVQQNQELIITGNFNTRDMAPQDDASGCQFNDTTSLSENKSSSRGNLVERMTARAGFNAPRLNTESIRSADPTMNSDTQSAYLTIPPGLSPTTRLESVVFLSKTMNLHSSVILDHSHWFTCDLGSLSDLLLSLLHF